MSRINSLLENILGFALVWYPSSYTVSKAILRQVEGGGGTKGSLGSWDNLSKINRKQVNNPKFLPYLVSEPLGGH